MKGAIVQVLVDLKSADPTALTAEEAIRNLLGFGPRLADLRRRHLHEIVLAPGPSGPQGTNLPDLLSVYLEQTVVFWNPNKHRAWVRGFPTEIGGPFSGKVSWEALPGGVRKEGPFGRPDLVDPDWDHVLLWSSEGTPPPPDMAAALAPWEVHGVLRTELYSLLWREDSQRGHPGEAAPPEKRREWTQQVAVARARGEGLLVNPHFQEHRVLHGAVPLPLAAGIS